MPPLGTLVPEAKKRRRKVVRHSTIVQRVVWMNVERLFVGFWLKSDECAAHLRYPRKTLQLLAIVLLRSTFNFFPFKFHYYRH